MCVCVCVGGRGGGRRGEGGTGETTEKSPARWLSVNGAKGPADKQVAFLSTLPLNLSWCQSKPAVVSSSNMALRLS